jgi:hypothetical protein
MRVLSSKMLETKLVPAFAQEDAMVLPPPTADDSRSADLLAFAIPFLQFVQLNVVGVLYASELLALTMFLWLACKGKLRPWTRSSGTFIVLGSLWLVSQCVTDIVRHSEFADFARGWSKIAMTLTIFSLLYTLLYEQPRRIMLFGWGVVAGSFLTFVVSPSEFAAGDPWKFGLAYPVTLAAFLWCSRERERMRWPVIGSAGLGVINIFLGSRSRGGICLAVALYLLLDSLRKHPAETTALNVKSFLIVVASIALAVLGVFGMYRYAANSGLLGRNAKQDYEDQSAGDYGILLGGRSAILGSIPAIYDSPILGHGSWARDPIYVLAQVQAMAAMGYENTSAVQDEELEEGYIPAHSYIFGAWVEAGIVGAIFWVWVLVLAVRALLSFSRPNLVWLPLLAFCAISLAWDLMFSPFGAQARIIVPYYIVLLMTHLGLASLKAPQDATAPVVSQVI